jgi:hypothetical protein
MDDQESGESEKRRLADGDANFLFVTILVVVLIAMVAMCLWGFIVLFAPGPRD